MLRQSFSSPDRCRLGLAVVAIALSALASPRAFAQDTAVAQDTTGKADALLVEPFVSDATILIVKVDPQRIGSSDANAASLGNLGRREAAVAEFSASLTAVVEEAKALADGQPIFATIGIPVSGAHRQFFAFRKQTSPAASEKTLAAIKQRNLLGDVSGSYVVVRTVKGDAPLAHSANRSETVAAAFAASAEFPIQVLIIPPNHLRRTIVELSPQLPSQLGGGPSRVLTDGLLWASVGFDLEQLRIHVTVQSASEVAAREFAAHLPKLLSSLYETALEKTPFPAPLVKRMIGAVDPKVEASQVKIQLNGLGKTVANVALLDDLVKLIKTTSRRHSNSDRFKQILLGTHNYAESFDTFPPADKYRDKDGRQQLSWRVHLLPFLGYVALYEQFRLDESWDSSHNKPLMAKMPDIYKSGAIPAAGLKAGYTTFLAPVGENTIYGQAEASKFFHVTDGTSNTVLLVEVDAAHAVPWTAPQDFRFDPQDPLAGVLIGTDGRWLAAFADGSVHTFKKASAEMALRLFEMNDGHPIDVDAIR
jgi:hypothetical protein